MQSEGKQQPHIDAKGHCAMERYPEISEHGLIGDLQTAALVSTDGTIDWDRSPFFRTTWSANLS